MSRRTQHCYDTGMGDDAEIVAALRAGDERAFSALVSAWAPLMRRVARQHVGSDASADDVVQEAWVGILRGLDTFEGRSSLRTWAFRILVNTARSTGVREHRTTPVEPSVAADRFQDSTERYPGGWRSFPDAWPGPADEAEAGEVRRVVATAVRTLPERQRVVITLRDLHGFGSDEVCDLLAVTPENQRVLLHRARSTVRGRLEEHYGGVR